MPSFKDANGREWLVKLDAPKIRELRNRLEFDLVTNPGEAFQNLAADPILLVDVLWVLVGSQKTDVTDVQFGESLGGDSLEAAANALTEATLDFFRPAQRSLLRSLDEKQKTLIEKASKLAKAKIDNPELEEKFLANLETQMDQTMEQLLRINRPTPTMETGAPGAISSPASVESAHTA